MHSTSSSLLERLRDPAADRGWDRFVDLFTPLLFTWARQLGLGEAEAADLVRDVLTVLMTKVRAFAAEANGGFCVWLHATLMSQWLDLCRRRQPGSPSGDDQVYETVDLSKARKEYGKQLPPRALQVLRPEFDAADWQVGWEHIVRGRPAADVGAELCLNEAAVYAARYRVLHRLRQELHGLLD